MLVKTDAVALRILIHRDVAVHVMIHVKVHVNGIVMDAEGLARVAVRAAARADAKSPAPGHVIQRVLVRAQAHAQVRVPGSAMVHVLPVTDALHVREHVTRLVVMIVPTHVLLRAEVIVPVIVQADAKDVRDVMHHVKIPAENHVAKRVTLHVLAIVLEALIVLAERTWRNYNGNNRFVS